MAQHHKVETDLSPEDLAALKEFVREKNGTRTQEECFEWVQARGYTISSGAVWNWLAKFRGELMRERIGRSSELAAAIKSAVAGGSFEDVATGVNTALLNRLFEVTAKLEADGEIGADELEAHSRTLKNLIGGKRDLEAYKANVAAALKAAETQAAVGKSAVDVVDVIKQSLGLK